ncbi:LuxR C-terminal-related transcriptional regulator [Sulfurimonas sp.]
MNVVLHSDDLFLIEHWETSLKRKCSFVDSLDDLKKVVDSIIIINYSACDSKCEDILRVLSNKNKVLILHRTPSLDTAKFVLSYGAKGYGNALMKSHFIVAAVDTIKEGMIWLYPEFTTKLIADIPSHENNQNISKLDVLSSREKEVALLLKDGDTYKNIAEKLNITPRTVKAHAQHVYQKLVVKDRLGLALLLR